MTFDEAVQALAGEETDPIDVLERMLGEWETYSPSAQGLLSRYAQGHDLAEVTPKALYFLIPALAEKGDTASFASLCSLAWESDRLLSALGDDDGALTYGPALISTFGGDVAPLLSLLDHPTADDAARGDAVLVLANLTIRGLVSERLIYDFLANYPSRVTAGPESLVWGSFAVAVATLGFSGLSQAVRTLFDLGRIPRDWLTLDDFWAELRYTQQNGRSLDGEMWVRFDPITDAVAHLCMLADDMDDGAQPNAGRESSVDLLQPVRNPLRALGRNDPCPCGSGRKFKKCCLVTG